jgi:hypothetical protein
MREPAAIASLGIALGFCIGFVFCLGASTAEGTESADALFQDGTKAYQLTEYARASRAFRKSAGLQLASGTLQNLGNAEWQRGEAGAAILAWEQALWVDGFNHAARQNLSYARKAAELESPEFSWHEAVSTWLPVNSWAWITGASLWWAVGMVLLPGIIRRPRAAWHQATAALGLTIFLISLPAHLGVQSRTNIGFILHQDTPLRLTPTAEAEVITRLRAGAPARVERTKGKFALVRTNRTQGWIEAQQLGLICPKPVK